MSRCILKLQIQEPYDVLVPSDYMIERLIEEDLLQKLDKSKLTCMDKLAGAVKGLPYDPKMSILCHISGEQWALCMIKRRWKSEI